PGREAPARGSRPPRDRHRPWRWCRAWHRVDAGHAWPPPDPCRAASAASCTAGKLVPDGTVAFVPAVPNVLARATPPNHHCLRSMHGALHPLEPGCFYGVNRTERHVRGLILSETEYNAKQRVPPHVHKRAYFALLLGGGYEEELGRSV